MRKFLCFLGIHKWERIELKILPPTYYHKEEVCTKCGIHKHTHKRVLVISDKEILVLGDDVVEYITYKELKDSKAERLKNGLNY